MDRYAVVEDRRREVFCDWLARLGAGGWSGTAGELHEELTRFLDGHRHRYGADFPAGGGLSKWLNETESVVAAAGRQLRFTRTKSARLIAFTPPTRVKPAPTDPRPSTPRPAVTRRPAGSDGFGVLDLFTD